MDINSLYQVYFHCELETKEEVYSFISEIICQDDLSQKEEVVKLFNQRDKVGSTLIAEHVMLPHIESNLIKKSQIIFIRLANPIQSWDIETKDIRLLIVILLKENEDVQVKNKISSFIRMLAYEEYIHRLLTIDDEETFMKEIRKH